MSRQDQADGPADRTPSSSPSIEDLRIEKMLGTGEVEDRALARCGLARIDYVDHFVLTTATGTRATSESWARAMFGDVPDRGERLIWQGLLQLRLRPGPSPSTVAGWHIARREKQWIRLETSSWAVRAELVIHVTEHSVSLTTFLQYVRFVGRLVWTTLSPVHRRLTPGILRKATATTEDPHRGRRPRRP
ncbi:hypothetical protein [Brachybacterium sacelli]|uniref:DUF2867 domain-containing protein n=1 Tax=Brachybacterium sacelli TaxID=173364 RepID=A0ABS4WZE0_9MICO|nr:hypothetical protein [Brachybacterium sacelli]MBP2381570.1 hypothetical protein [Brachybacterium sacelli]